MNTLNKDENFYSLNMSKFQSDLDELKLKNHYIGEQLGTSVKNFVVPEDTNHYIPQYVVSFQTVFPFTPPVLKVELFEKFDYTNLMFIFFIQNDPFARYNAGKELTKRDWMYHTIHQTWFQLAVTPPKSQNQEAIEGKFKYWDFQKEWGPAIKKEFKFELKYWEKFEN